MLLSSLKCARPSFWLKLAPPLRVMQMLWPSASPLSKRFRRSVMPKMLRLRWAYVHLLRIR